MADQIATRYGILNRDLSHAALQTIVLTAADAIDALDEAHQWLRRLGVPDPHAAHQTPRQRWEQLLRNLFPASIVLVDPHGSASPDLVKLPAGSDDEQAVRRLLNAAAAFLLAETTTLEDSVELSQHWTSSDPAGPDEDLDTAEALLERAARAARTLLDHAESGRWRDLLATYAPQSQTPDPVTHTPPKQVRAWEALLSYTHRSREELLAAGKCMRDLAALPTPRHVMLAGGFGQGKTALLAHFLHDRIQRTLIYIDISSSAPAIRGVARWCAESFGPAQSVGYSRCATKSTLANEMAAYADRNVVRFYGLWASLIEARSSSFLRLTSAALEEIRRPGITRLDCLLGHGRIAPWAGIPVPLLDVSAPVHPILPGSPQPETNEISATSRPLLVATNHLDSADTATRLAGLSMLEAFGQANPSQRQTVVNVLCSYLRTPPPEAGCDLDEWRVRAAAQTALAGQLRPDTDPAHPAATYWAEVYTNLDLDLTHAVLTDLDLTGCHVRTARFTMTRFRGNTSFSNMRFVDAVFDGAEFEDDVVFEQVVFVDDTRFRHAIFHRVAIFEGARFGGDVRFDAAHFARRVVFTGSVFSEDVRFSETRFSGDAIFDRVTFAGLARFGQARFLDGIRFRETCFNHGQDDKQPWDLGAALLEQEPCWIRTNHPTTLAPGRVLPTGWTVQPTLDHPAGEDGDSWGRLMPAPQPLSRLELSATASTLAQDTEHRWTTRPNCRLIAVPVPHQQALNRLLDVLPLIEADNRVQVVFITPVIESRSSGVAEPIRHLGGLCMPWQQAQRTRFDLVLAASTWAIQDLTGPVMLMPHRASMIRLRFAARDDQMPHDLHSAALMPRDEVVPAALTLTHEGELEALKESWPEAVSRAAVVGDLSFDRMLASQRLRQDYREALGVRDDRRLVVVSTTSSPHSLFATNPRIFAQLMAELPADHYQVIGVLHPSIWRNHGRRQVLAWLDDAQAAGLNIVPPEEDWRAAVVSADLVVGDHGSVTQYAAGLDIPVLMLIHSLADVPHNSTAALIARLSHWLHPDRPLRPQLEMTIATHNSQRYAKVADLLTSRPTQAGALLRNTAYRLLNMPEPTDAVNIPPVPLPRLIPQRASLAREARRTDTRAHDADSQEHDVIDRAS